jgi:hypothetical protein
VAFAANTAYTATIALTANSGYTFDGVSPNFFSVGGAVGVSSAGTGTTMSVTVTFPATGAAAVQKGPLTVYNMASGVIRVNVTRAGVAVEEPFPIAAYSQETKQIPIGAQCVVTVTYSGDTSPAWTGDMSQTETKLEFTAVANAPAPVRSTLPTTAPAGESAISLEIRNDDFSGSSIVKVKIEEQSDGTKYDTKYESLVNGNTQTWTNLFSNTRYKITVWIAPAAAGGNATTEIGYVKVRSSPGKIKYDGAGLVVQTNADPAVDVSPNPLPDLDP